MRPIVGLLLFALAALGCAAPKLKIAILPVVWHQPVFNVIGGTPFPQQRVTNPDGETLLWGEMGSLGKQAFDVISFQRVLDVMAIESVRSSEAAYRDNWNLERLRIRLGADMLIAPIGNTFDWFYDRQDPPTCTHVDSSGEVHQTQSGVALSGHKGAMDVRVSTARKTGQFDASDEVADEELNPGADRINAKQIARNAYLRIKERLVELGLAPPP